MAEYRVKEEESFLYYARSNDGWTCPSCETELPAEEGSCFLCGCSKAIWEQQKRSVDWEDNHISSTPVVPEKKSMMPRVVIALLIIAALLALFYFATQGAEPAQAELLEQIITETEESLSVM